MQSVEQCYLNGQWVTPSGDAHQDIINPANGAVVGQLRLGDAADVDAAVAAARAAFPAYAATTPGERGELLQAIVAEYKRRGDDLAQAISTEMGAPLQTLARPAQVGAGLGHFVTAAKLLPSVEFERRQGTTQLLREPIGVCALISPWNWPANQIACKVAPALAAGCTMVLKPSEIAPYSATILAEILHAAGVPAGVFNLIHGTGAVVGNALTAHPDVAFVSFTGSTQAGKAVMKNAAETIKKVALELGGKSANIILDDADLPKAVTHAVLALMNNSGQSCNAPSRLLVPQDRLAEVEALAVAALARVKVGDPADAATTMGPVSSQAQYDKIRALIDRGITEGAKLLAGGLTRPDDCPDDGFYVAPTVFSRVSNRMTIAREEIFGPVLCILPYRDDADAVAIANDTPYGLSGYVSGGDPARVQAIARQLRTGMVHLNGARGDLTAPFGGYKQSGIGREWGLAGIEEFLESKAVMGWT